MTSAGIVSYCYYLFQ